METNAQKALDHTIADLTARGETPSLLLHSCCGPCSSYVLEYLSSVFRITVFYYNPNISPEGEYRKRVEEQKRLIKSLPTVHPVAFLEGEYDPQTFTRLSAGLESEKEGGARCMRCYALRLRQTARRAKEGGFEWFTTTLSVSPYKNAAKLNEIGVCAAQEFDVRYLTADFKKKNGYHRSIELSRLYGLYRQNYCGCAFSLRQRLEKEAHAREAMEPEAGAPRAEG